ncbi:MAG: hypothetical protein ACO3QB_12550, partial [bacterium]
SISLLRELRKSKNLPLDVIAFAIFKIEPLFQKEQVLLSDISSIPLLSLEIHDSLRAPHQ